MCAYRGLRSWPGSKPSFPLFIGRSGLLKVKSAWGPHPWPLPGGSEWRHPWGQQPFISLHRSLPGREIAKVHFELSAWDLPVICHGQRAITGTQSRRRTERGKVCLSSKIIVFASATVTDTSSLCPRLNCTEERSFTFSLGTHVLRKPGKDG